jgi:hypothetical protein
MTEGIPEEETPDLAAMLASMYEPVTYEAIVSTAVNIYVNLRAEIVTTLRCSERR